MPTLQIDLLGEREEILRTLQDSLSGRLISTHATSASGLQSSVQIQSFPKAQECLSHWKSLISRDSLDTQRVLFLISPNEFAAQDEHQLNLWRVAVDEASQTQSLSLQIIRGNWEGGVLGALCQNAGYAFAVALQAALSSLNAQKQTENLKQDLEQYLEQANLRPIPKPLYNYACEKCSDPECEHALFGFLSSGKKS